MTINIIDRQKTYEFYNVPDKVGKAIITILNECEKDSNICSCISENKTVDKPLDV